MKPKADIERQLIRTAWTIDELDLQRHSLPHPPTTVAQLEQLKSLKRRIHKKCLVLQRLWNIIFRRRHSPTVNKNLVFYLKLNQRRPHRDLARLQRDRTWTTNPIPSFHRRSPFIGAPPFIVATLNGGYRYGNPRLDRQLCSLIGQL
jgi:hypothetical protein